VVHSHEMRMSGCERSEEKSKAKQRCRAVKFPLIESILT
jgi:hypothetical protein